MAAADRAPQPAGPPVPARTDRADARGASPPGRRHRLLPHTADAGLSATAADLAGLFEEAALALAELSAEVPAGGAATGPGTIELPVELEAADLAGLAFAWLNELIGLADVHRAAIVGTEVARLEHEPGRVRLVSLVRLVPFDDVGVFPRLAVKSATFHRLAVRAGRGAWRLTAYVDT